MEVVSTKQVFVGVGSVCDLRSGALNGVSSGRSGDGQRDEGQLVNSLTAEVARFFSCSMVVIQAPLEVRERSFVGTPVKLSGQPQATSSNWRSMCRQTACSDLHQGALAKNGIHHRTCRVGQSECSSHHLRNVPLRCWKGSAGGSDERRLRKMCIGSAVTSPVTRRAPFAVEISSSNLFRQVATRAPVCGSSGVTRRANSTGLSRQPSDESEYLT